MTQETWTPLPSSSSEQPTGQAQVPLPVPWSTVAVLGLLLSAGDTFWAIALRGAVGAVGRAGEPFSLWVSQTVTLAPAFAAAALAALTLALYRQRCAPRSGRHVIGAGLLVVATTTSLGLAAVVAGAVQDYRVQTGQLLEQHAMQAGAVPLVAAQQATLELQVRASTYAAGILLLTNLVLVAWVAAARGGRLGSSASGATGRGPHGPEPPVLWAWLVAALLGSGVIHASVVPAHLQHWRAAGTFFVLLALLQGGVALASWRHPGRVALRAAAAVSVGPLALWTVSRTVGLPVGPDPGSPEAIGGADLSTGALEVLVTLLVVVLLRTGGLRSSTWGPSAGHLRALGTLVVLAVAVLGVRSGPQHDVPADTVHEHHAVEPVDHLHHG